MTTVPKKDELSNILVESPNWLLWQKGRRKPFGWDETEQEPDFKASWTNPDDLLTFERAREIAAWKDDYGIGFVTLKDSELVALDLDDCLTTEGFKEWLPALDVFLGETYIEYSPSGNGLHLFAIHPGLPDWWSNSFVEGKDHEGVEAYEQKFFTVTGDKYPDSADEIGDPNPEGFLWKAYKNINGETPNITKTNPSSGGNSGGQNVTNEDVDVSVYEIPGISASRFPEGERQAHPVHGSNTGANFHIDEGGETWVCWRGSCDSHQGHATVGNALHLLGMKKGIIECGQWTPEGSGVSSDDWGQIFDEARDIGLNVPEKQRQPTNEASTLVQADGNGTTQSESESGSADSDAIDEMYLGEEQEKTHADAIASAGDSETHHWYERARSYTSQIEALPASETPRVSSIRTKIARFIDEEYDLICPQSDNEENIEELLAYNKETGMYDREGINDIRRDSSLGVPWLSTGDLDEVLKLLSQANAVERGTLNAGAYDETLVCCPNGVINVETGERSDHAPEYRHRTGINASIDQTADCSNIREFLHSVVRTDKEVKTLLQWIGFCLTDGYEPQKFLIIHGSGGNGKGVFFRILREFFGKQNRASVNFSELTDEESFKLPELDGKMIQMDPDIPSKQINADESAMLKKLTGDDEIEVRRIYQDSFEMTNSAKITLGGNEPPRFYESNDSIARRFIDIEFPYSFTNDENDGNKDAIPESELIDKLLTGEELSGLLNAAIEAYADVDRQFAVELDRDRTERFEEYMRKADPIIEFSETVITNKQEYCLPKDTVYSLYKSFCEKRGTHPTHRSAFFRALGQQEAIEIHETRPRISEEDGRIQTFDHMFIRESALEHLTLPTAREIRRINAHKYGFNSDYIEALLSVTERDGGNGLDTSELSESTENDENEQSADSDVSEGNTAESERDEEPTPVQATTKQVHQLPGVKHPVLLARLGDRCDLSPDQAETAIADALKTGRIVEREEGKYEIP